DVDNLKELYLPNPRSSIRSVYLYNDKGRLYEVQKVSNGRSSWLLDSHLYKDGGVRFITPVDPLLIALPIFQNAFQQDKNEFKTLDDILCRQNILEQKRAQPLDVHRLINISGFIEQLAHICDMQEIAPAFFAYRLNEKSVLTWLEKKVDRLLNNPTFKAYFTENEDENTVKLEAVYTLSNYLNRQWFEKLLDKLQ
ncbi:ribonuclease H2, subunit B, partial [Mycotypha africana]|uniref:ribonuclease H2, subunit B n=1 Tax=Mycotypha africana TaxID=64632 RepID=UPI0023017C71